MDNSAIADRFSLLAKLMDIHGENSFKSKTYSIAAFNIDKLEDSLKEMPREQLSQMKGIGDSVRNKIIELLDTNEMASLQDFIHRTPAGVIEMLNIKGIGPKKIHTIWKEMELESVGELLYACNENRLTLFKGFGPKTQANVQESIEFYLLNQGNFLYAQVDDIFPQIDRYLKQLFGDKATHVTGAYRRQESIITELEYVVLDINDAIKPKFVSAQPPELLEETPTTLLYKLKNGLRLRLYTGGSSLPLELFKTTATSAFLETFALKESTSIVDESSFFEQAGIPFIHPSLRSDDRWLKSVERPTLIEVGDVKGIIHSHSKWSDGATTIEEMANECIRLGLEYLVISDHSKAAAYANGLSEERIKQQHLEVDALNKKLAPFHIFKSIECDILNDGSMDYSDDVLGSFDMVIASVHSNLKMSEEKAMSRILKAISNPYVTILGHPTGRLLLSRRGYPLDHEELINACVKHNVVLEINAHPRRLDLDWTWIPQAMEKGVMLSINPDAHYLEGFRDIKYGILAAQKGGLTKEFNLSSLSLDKMKQYLLKRLEGLKCP